MSLVSECPHSLVPMLMARNKKEHLAVWNMSDSGAQGAQKPARPHLGGKGGQTVVKLQLWARENGELCLGLAEKGPLLCGIVPAVGQGSSLGHRDRVVWDSEKGRWRLWLLYCVGNNLSCLLAQPQI